MARRIAFTASGWHTIPEVAGHIKVYAGGAHPVWFDIKKVSIYANGWSTVWQLSSSQAAHATHKPPVHEAVYHTTTTSANIRGGKAYWAFVSGRHVTRQTLIYQVGLRTYSTPITLGVTNRVLPAGVTKAVIRYTYY